MRRFVALLALFIATLSCARAADPEFLRVWPQWRDTASFQRIGEFFGAPENTGREIVLRTQPENRDGYYFLVRVKHATPLAEAKFTIHLIRPDAPDARVFTFPLPRPLAARGETVFQLGLTGADWPGGEKAQPVAWKLELLAADNRVLAAEKSFLWEKPASERATR